ITTIAAGAVDGSVFVDGFFAESPVPHVVSFVNGFRDRYGAVPDLLAAQAYDTLTMCARVLRSGVRTRPEMRDGLAQISDFPGVSGVTSMDVNGDAEKVLYLLSVRGGRIIQINAPAFRYPDAGDPAD
ncbi:MAG: ABC transporter substrate-binding protein, partial [Chloroflexi bacterium]|nr:ABC transporter substrate-binding protein [Chloroflexota bacterium]